MRAGPLRHRVTIQQKTVTRSSTGQENITWTDLDTVWAAVEPLRGREFLEARRVHDEVMSRIRIRYRNDLEPEMRVTWEGHTYDIQAVLPVNERNRQIELMVREIT